MEEMTPWLGGQGNDTLTPGPGGNNLLIGGTGTDMFVFHPGHGVNTISAECTPTAQNIIYFPDSSITKDDIRTQLNGTTLTLYYDNQGDAINLLNFDYNTQHVVETLEFSDNTQIPLINFVNPTAGGNNYIVGGNGDVCIDGRNGVNDTIYGGTGNDTIYGGPGNDYLVGGTGYNEFVGGPGNDTLIGGPGNDTYVFNLGDGVDAITDTSTLQEGNVISFGPGITKDDITTKIDGSTLDLYYGNQGDEIQLENYDYNQINGTHVVETLQFADNTSMRLTQLVDPASSGNDLVYASQYFDDLSRARVVIIPSTVVAGMIPCSGAPEATVSPVEPATT